MSFLKRGKIGDHVEIILRTVLIQGDEMSRHYDNVLLERIKDASDIVTVLSEYITLKKKGRNYWGCCPFHNEKTPSFSVSPEKGFFYCFGCRASGNVFNFLMRYENIPFPEAVERLAIRAGIDLPVEEINPRVLAQEKENEKMYEANDLAATYFHNCLTQTEMGKEALNYLQDRGLSAETIAEFRLGFAPPGWDKLYRAFSDRGIDESILLAAGLCRKNDESNRVYDYFRNRVMFPICDGRGRVVAFGGRVMDDSQPKYLNSSETRLFNKGKLLFAFDKAYRSIREKKQVILVEGYMDVISAHNRGITNVVASLGTAFTEQQRQILVRQADEIILAYDMDGAGQTAARRAIELTQNTDFKVRIVAMPDGKDPDDYVRNHGPKAFLELVNTAVPPFEYLLNGALIRHDSANLNGKLAVMNELFPFIMATQEPVRREGYLKALALPLWLDNSAVFKYFREYTHKHDRRDKGNEKNQADARGAVPTTAEPTTVTAAQNGSASKTEEQVLAMALSDGNALETVRTYIPLEDFSLAMHQNMLEQAEQAMQARGTFVVSDLESLYAEDEKKELSRLMVLYSEQYTEDALYNYMKALRLTSLRMRYKHHSRMADSLNRSGDPKFIDELKRCQALQNEIKEWS